MQKYSKIIIIPLASLLLLFVIFAVLKSNLYSSDMGSFMFKVNFLAENRRFMSNGENYMYTEYGEMGLISEEDCKELDGIWTGDYYQRPYPCLYDDGCDYCALKAGDAGKKCYDDNECKSFCEVKSEYASYGRCFPYLVPRRDGCNFYYFRDGKIEKIGGWC